MYDMIVINNLSFQSGGCLLLRSCFKSRSFGICCCWLLTFVTDLAVKEDDGLRVLEFINVLLRHDRFLVLISFPRKLKKVYSLKATIFDLCVSI